MEFEEFLDPATRAKIQKYRVKNEQLTHQLTDFISGLNLTDLESIHHMMDLIVGSGSDALKEALVWKGYLTGLLAVKGDYCIACGEAHTASIPGFESQNDATSQKDTPNALDAFLDSLEDPQDQS